MADSDELADFFPDALVALVDGKAEAFDELKRREVHLDLPEGFLVYLVRDERAHWSFLLQLHALVEAAVEHLLIANLQRPELTDFIGHLNIGAGRLSKQALGAKLKAFDEIDLALIQGLTDMRNA